MPEPDREQIKRLIEKTPEEITRTILLMMLTILERQDDDRTALKTHQINEEHLLKTIAADPEAHHQQHAYIATLMEAQAAKLAASAAVRRAIIEKSLAGLIWACIAFLGSRALSFITTHWTMK